MSRFRQFDVSDDAVQDALLLGVSPSEGGARIWVAHAARYGTPAHHLDGNVRFDDFLLWIEGSRVVSVKRYTEPRQDEIESTELRKDEYGSSRKIRVFEV